MYFIDPNLPSFKVGVIAGRLLKKIILWSSLGLLSYMLGKYSNKNTTTQKFSDKRRF